jgi:alkylation response protein AidB-like acyl-CoA dehydrogenase
MAIAPHAAAWDRDGAHLPRDLVREWVSLGLNALQVSPERGGPPCPLWALFGGGCHEQVDRPETAYWNDQCQSAWFGTRLQSVTWENPAP